MRPTRHSDGLGVPLAGPRVALSAKTRSCLAVGFSLQSLTRLVQILCVVLSFQNGVSAQWLHPYRFMTEELIKEKNVKCITVFDEKEKGPEKSTDICFDREGRMLQSIVYWGRTAQPDSELFVYDSNGNEIEYIRISWVTMDFTPTGEPILQKMRSRYTSQYVNNRCVRTDADSIAYSLGQSHYALLKYDSLGYTVEETAVDTIKQEVRRTVTHKDKENREILRLSYNPDGSLNAFNVIIYDAQGNKIISHLKNVGKNSHYQSETRYFYDAEGRLIRQENYSDGASVSKIEEYRYDASGLLTQIISAQGNRDVTYTFYQ